MTNTGELQKLKLEEEEVKRQEEEFKKKEEELKKKEKVIFVFFFSQNVMHYKFDIL